MTWDGMGHAMGAVPHPTKMGQHPRLHEADTLISLLVNKSLDYQLALQHRSTTSYAIHRGQILRTLSHLFPWYNPTSFPLGCPLVPTSLSLISFVVANAFHYVCQSSLPCHVGQPHA